MLRSDSIEDFSLDCDRVLIVEQSEASQYSFKFIRCLHRGGCTFSSGCIMELMARTFLDSKRSPKFKDSKNRVNFFDRTFLFWVNYSNS